jgi:protein gp37
MSDTTGIEWTDATWNPTTGCTKVSPGCDHCYAKTMYERFNGKDSFESVTLHPKRLTMPLRWRKPRKVFVNSMSDLFHADVPDDYIAQVFAIMSAGHHTYQVLTKRHARMRSLLSTPEFRTSVEALRNGPLWSIPGEMVWPLPNVWMGVSVENQKWADIRIPALLDTPAAVRWISAEPLLGPVELNPYWVLGEPTWGREYPEPTSPNGVLVQDLVTKPGLDWVVVGGESGPGARPMHPAWARSLRDQCTHANVPFLFKQWGGWTATAALGAQDGTGRSPWAHREVDAWVNQLDGRTADETTATAEGGSWMGVYRVGKKAAGRELDRETWDQYPVLAATKAGGDQL